MVDQQVDDKGTEKMKRATATSTVVAWWWFDAGTEICSTCQQSYAYQTGVYCLDCDSNICSLCVQESETGESRCSGCCDE